VLSACPFAGEVPTLATLADAPDAAPASAAAARALQAHGVTVASSSVASERTSADGAALLRCAALMQCSVPPT
jgi:hypothetical protein